MEHEDMIQYRHWKAELLKAQDQLVDYLESKYKERLSSLYQQKSLHNMRLSQYYLPNFVIMLGETDDHIAQQIAYIRKLWGTLNEIGQKIRKWY